jgi:hypothetical protein
MKKILFALVLLGHLAIQAQEKTGAQQFWENLQKHCGQSFEGEINAC